MSAPLQIANTLESAADRCARRAADYLAGSQQRDGHWCAELTADTTLESDYILFQLWLYPPVKGKWRPSTRLLVDKAAAAILDRQLSDGGFNICVQGPSEVSASVKAYFALKLAGIAIDDPHMARLRNRILELGGIQAANSYVKVNLSLFDLYPRQYCPSIPPEIVLLPFQFLYQMSSWTRAIAVSLSIVHSANPRRPVPEGFHLDELWLPGVSPAFRKDSRWFTWHNTFLAVDGLLKWWERSGLQSVRRKAIRKAAEWMIERLRHSDGLGAIYPPMMYSVMALDVLDYAPDDPLRAEALSQFNSLMVDDGERFFFQPCFSPVWDTGIAAYALAQQDPEHPAVRRAADWLLAREVRRKGDWSVKRPNTEPSGWAFEYSNEFYPDVDDTAMVLLALADAAGSDGAAQRACHKRAVDWLLAMQSGDGGWAAFDADNNWKFLNQVPFADHNAMLDPTCADITGRVLEALAAQGVSNAHPAVRRGVNWLVRNQEPDGSWYGRWGVAYIYGTCFALRGLAASGESDREAHVLRAGEWLRSIQNADGGWGESCASYDNGVFTGGPSTPSQTAWAILGLIAGGDVNSLSVQHGIEYLLETQTGDGSWAEELATGTGFPKVFYLNYHLYKDYFPLLALTSFVKARANTNG
ncbi:MAG TPA: squalene--hopene cyclase [Candidatus Sulfopaludibacter sp.]|nr:squalene--hopene cyclase [Candidatus Sulfopaludibacter sp.]